MPRRTDLCYLVAELLSDPKAEKPGFMDGVRDEMRKNGYHFKVWGGKVEIIKLKESVAA